LPGAILLAGMAPPDPALLSATAAGAAPPVRVPPLAPPARAPPPAALTPPPRAPPPPPPAARTLLELKAAANRTASDRRMAPRARTRPHIIQRNARRSGGFPMAQLRPSTNVALQGQDGCLADANGGLAPIDPSHNKDDGHDIGRCVARPAKPKTRSGLRRLSAYGSPLRETRVATFRCSWAQALKSSTWQRAQEIRVQALHLTRQPPGVGRTGPD
jgi:hypothetical protein